MAGIRRKFMGWSRPLLHTVSEQWQETYQRSDDLDLSRLQVVVPVQRAVDSLLARLEQHAHGKGNRFIPPRVCTVGALPELLYRPRNKIASDLQQTLAWTHTLSSASDTELQPLLPNQVGRDSVEPWLDLAQTLKGLCEELASDALTPHHVVEQVESANDRSRWLLIDKLRNRYLARLTAAGLADPHEERRFAAADGSTRTDQSIYLVGCADIGLQICHLIDTVRDDVTAWIAAPENHSRLFDKYGRVEPQEWLAFEIEIRQSQLIAANDAQEQAASALACVERWRSHFDPNQICVGITDDTFAPLVESELELGNQVPHRLAGSAVSKTPPGRLLLLVRDHLQSKSWESMAALIRHADLLQTLADSLQSNSLHLLGAVDRFRNDHLVTYVSQSLPGAFKKQNKALDQPSKLVEGLRDWVEAWLAPFDADQLPLRHWCERVAQILRAIYRNQESAHQRTDRAMQRFDEMLQQIEQLPESLDVEFSSITAIELILQRLDRSFSIIDARPEACTEIVGWLDLSLDDSEALVVAGMNHPFVPKSVTADPFLPGNLRSTLKVQDNERRFARDAYMLNTILACRPQCALIVGKFGPDGSPTPPSRLLAACAPEDTVERIQWLLSGKNKAPSPQTRWDAKQLLTTLPIPKPAKSKPLNSISVTAFRDYLTCPNRFYLRHVLGLRPLGDELNELAANQFGDLVHAAVEEFGRCDDKHLRQEAEIFEAVVEHLRAYAASMYGSHPNASVRLQIQQAELRLRHFSAKQAERIAEGWTIVAAEASVTPEQRMGFQFEDGRALWLKGRVDRIDYHEEQNRYAILDYKTHGHKPLRKHYDAKNEIWHDLQLPLYLQMLPALNIETEPDRVDLGYFNIAEELKDTGVNIAAFNEKPGDKLLESAEKLARETALAILDQQFEPAADASDVPFDDYGMILQTNTDSFAALAAMDDEGDA